MQDQTQEQRSEPNYGELETFGDGFRIGGQLAMLAGILNGAALAIQAYLDGKFLNDRKEDFYFYDESMDTAVFQAHAALIMARNAVYSHRDTVVERVTEDLGE